MNKSRAGWLLGVAFLTACGADEPTQAGRSSSGADVRAALEQSLAAARAGADSVIDALRPVALMTGAQEEALRRYGNAQHLERARALGVRPADDAEIERLVAAGRLIALSDSSDLYAIELTGTGALVVPRTVVLMEDVGRRFQAALGERGLPAYRPIVSSALRSAEGQAALRRTNANAAAGTSTHEFGTTVDILYEAFAAPRALPAAYVPDEPAWLRAHTRATARALLEHAAARKSRELTAILGGVLREMQAEGEVYVTLERQQPVFHITVAR